MTRRLLTGVGFTVLFAAVAAAGLAVAITGAHDRAGSQRTQRAAPVAAVVLTDEVESHVTRAGGTRYATRLGVRLDAPGGATTTVHVADQVRGMEGRRIQIVIDPDDPAYAELPGRPAAGSTPVVVGTICAVVFGLIALAWLAVSAQRFRRLRRS